MPFHIDFYLWCAFQVFVFLKLGSNVFIQGKARSQTGIVGYPEDRNGSKRLVIPNPASAADLPLVRASNLFRNDLENIIPFSLLALAASFVQVDARMLMGLLLVYALARVSHAVCLLKGIQPFRSVSYLLGQVCALILLVLMVIRLAPFLQAI